MRQYLYAGAAAIAIMAPVGLQAQETTSSVRGTVASSGTPIAGAEVTLVHGPSGTTSNATTNADGGYSLSGLRIGGPFTLTVAAAGYEDASVTEIFLQAGTPFRLPIDIQQANEIVVTAARSGGLEQSTGPITSIGREEIEAIASVSRDIRDIARRDPFATIDQSNSRAIEIAGQNGRLNKFSVDGVRFSDNFGLNNGGLPTARGPVPLDAIEQLSVKVAPYDVSEGDFQGGAINVVLRSGGNDLTGSGFYTYTDDSLTGDKTKPTVANPTGIVNLDFKSRNYGGFLSGPIFKDKLFFAFSYERLKENRPSDIGLAGAANVVPNLTAAQVADISATAGGARYMYDTLGIYDSVDESDEKYTGKLDWNISDSQRASFTYIYNKGTIGNPQGSSTSAVSPALGLRSNAYLLTEKVQSGVFQLNSDWSDDFSTEVRVKYRKSDRAQESFGGLDFGQFTVCLDPTSAMQQNGAANAQPTVCSQGTTAAPGAPRILFGADPSRQANALSYEDYGANFGATLRKGDHTFKLIAAYNRLKVFNLFVQNALGTFYFDSLADYNNGRASQLVLGGSITGNINDAAATYAYESYNFALQDSWDVTDTLNVTAGARIDMYGSDDRPFFNQNFFNRYGFANTETYSGKQVIQPRFGASWNATDRLVIRGGIGLFAGGSPDVWLSNSFSNTGVVTNSITISRTGAGGTGCSATPATLCAAALDNVDGRTFNPAVLNFLRTNTASLAQATVNAIQPDFKIPSTWKSSLSVSYDADLGPLGDGWLLGGDVYYGFVNNAPNYTDLRALPNGVLPDGRPRYLSSTATGAGNQDLLLFNTKRGRSFVAVARFDKEWDFGLGIGASYSFQDIKDVNPTTSSTASSNYNQQAMVDPNLGVYGTSIYQIRHEVKFNLDYSREIFGDNKTRFSIFGEWRSGRPYSLTMNDATSFQNNRSIVFGTGGQSNRYLLYVPTSGTDPRVAFDSVATQTAFDNFIDANGLGKFRGRIISKNSERSPSYFKVDLHVDQEIPVPVLNGAKIKLFADLENVLNLIDSSWGSQRQVNFPYLAPLVNVTCLAAAGGAPITTGTQACAQYRYSNFQSPTITLQNQNRQSLWGLRIGAKFEF